MGILMTNGERRTKKRRQDDMVAAHCLANRLSQKVLLQNMAWERAKGELNSLIAICHTTPVTEHCRQIESRVADAITVINNIMEKEEDN